MGDQTDTSIELELKTNANDPAANGNGQRAHPESFCGVVKRRDSLEQPFIENAAAVAINGNAVPIERDVEAQTSPNQKQKRFVSQIKEELSQKVCSKKVPLWVVLILIFILVIGLIFASLALCAVMYEDPDEKYDATKFDLSRRFSGSFRLVNLNATEKLLNSPSNQTQPLAEELKKKLEDLYTNSPALGRYYSSSEIYNFSDGPVTASFHLTFRMPATEENMLKYFTLSREMVYNVFRQFLYDQEVDPSEPLYIEPTSLNMTE
ncbi:TPA-induced transmembrane protein homolog [Eucyclogobius newberryi]|uniref:TPA-induced transmembrane protein homolog n=1 Tax=Eucyclogobius newberryi TaxID=166745 RepID=UPI003B5A3342